MAENSEITVDIGDRCTHCGRSTAWGSGNGLYVDRCPSGADAVLLLVSGFNYDGYKKLFKQELDIEEIFVTVEGYLCRDCRAMDCDICGAEVLDDYTLDGRVMCPDCHDKEAEKGTCNCLDHMEQKGE